MTDSLKNVIDIARRAQQAVMTPDRIAEDSRREGFHRRDRNLAAARPLIKLVALRAIRDGKPLDTPPLREVRRWVGGGFRTGDGTVMILSGPRGCGKGVAAAWAIAEFGGAWVSALQLVNICTRFDQTEWTRLCMARMLVVDDIGDELQPEKFGPVFKELLDHRAPHAGKLIAPTNHGLDFLKGSADVKGRYPDPRLWSRMAESAEFVTVDGPDLRRGKS